MKDITVTMPLKEYEDMKKRLVVAEASSVDEYVDVQLVDHIARRYEIHVDSERLIRDVKENWKKSGANTEIYLDGKKIADEIVKKNAETKFTPIRASNFYVGKT